MKTWHKYKWIDAMVYLLALVIGIIALSVLPIVIAAVKAKFSGPGK